MKIIFTCFAFFFVTFLSAQSDELLIVKKQEQKSEVQINNQAPVQNETKTITHPIKVTFEYELELINENDIKLEVIQDEFEMIA